MNSSSNKQTNRFNCALFLLMTVFEVGFIVTNNKVLKGLASACFLTAGIINFSRTGEGRRAYAVPMLVGLILGFLADIGIVINFILGAALFAAGHIAYYVAYCRLEKPSRRDIMPIAILFTASASIILFAPFLVMGNVYRAVCVAYALIIAFMLGKAIGMYAGDKNKLYRVLLVGSIAFFASDLLLLVDKFTTQSTLWIRAISRALYFPAQFLFAQTLKAEYTEVDAGVDKPADHC